MILQCIRLIGVLKFAKISRGGGGGRTDLNKIITLCIGNHMGLSAIWNKIARQEASNCSRRSRVQFRPVVSTIF